MGSRRTSLAAIAIAVGILGAGCGGDDETSTASDPAGPLVVYQRSGGIAGVTEKLQVERDGSVTVNAGAVDPQRASFRLSDAELQDLSAELDAADFGAVSTPGPSACADCFIESVDTGGRAVTIVAEINQPPESVATALAHLRELVTRGAG
jgi:hypothetical protein